MSAICVWGSLFILLTSVSYTQAAASRSFDEPEISDPNLPAVADSNAIALETDNTEMFNPNWPNDFNEDVKVIMNFKEAMVSDVLDYLSKEAGLIIVYDAAVSGRITLISKQPLGIDEVIALISTVLKKEGQTAVRTGRTLQIISLSEARAAYLPVITVTKPEDLKEGDDVVTCIIPIRYADAIRLREDISPLLSDYAIVSSNVASNSLIITDTTANIKRLVKIVKAVDTQMSTVADVKVFLLEYADADSTADLINEIFQQRANSSSSGGSGNQGQNFMMQMMQGGRGGRTRGQEQQTSSGSSGANQGAAVIAAADSSANAVVVSGPSEMLLVVAEVVKEIDKNPHEEHEVFLYKLKYAQAENIKDRLNNLFQELENINEQNTRNTGGFGMTRGNTNSSSSESVTDEVYIEADEDTNSLIIMTSEKNYHKITAIIEKLDIPIPQVLIKVLLAELTTSDGTEFGIDWSVLSTYGEDSETINNLFETLPLGMEGFETRVVRGDLTATLKALQQTGVLNVLSRPYIMTSNNQTATISVGQRYPFVTDSVITDEGNVNNTVSYEDIGIILEVTPTINADGLVIMDVNPEITNALADTVQISSEVNATIFATRSAQCRVAVPNGHTVVIGGLMQDTETENVEQIPVIADLPIVGGLFKHTTHENSKTELLIFLTPQVTETVDGLRDISDFERGKSDFLNNMQGTPLQKQVENMESVLEVTEPEASSSSQESLNNRFNDLKESNEANESQDELIRQHLKKLESVYQNKNK